MADFPWEAVLYERLHDLPDYYHIYIDLVHEDLARH